MYRAYVLERSDGKYYYGSSSDVEKRLYWHNT
ncbi:MAG: GIY-YIG nuclease family protein [bacterium]|nr:GIY-YIG nuclease family protein [bacterium]